MTSLTQFEFAIAMICAGLLLLTVRHWRTVLIVVALSIVAIIYAGKMEEDEDD